MWESSHILIWILENAVISGKGWACCIFIYSFFIFINQWKQFFKSYFENMINEKWISDKILWDQGPAMKTKISAQTSSLKLDIGIHTCFVIDNHDINCNEKKPKLMFSEAFCWICRPELYMIKEMKGFHLKREQGKLIPEVIRMFGRVKSSLTDCKWKRNAWKFNELLRVV